jgi:predicted NAD/FAD-binding protein
MRIAVVGAGVSGLVAARVLCRDHDVHVFEAADYLGGHASTVDVDVDGGRFAVDTGFMVFNERTYPNFCELLSSLGVETQDSDMSFSVQCERTGLVYQGSSLDGLFAQRRNLLRPAFYGLLREILRFNREARRALRNDLNDVSLGDFLDMHRFETSFCNQYLLPMTAAIWSTRPARMRDVPARFILKFLDNHGLLQIRARPQWKTIRGGSRNYVNSIAEPFRNNIRLNTSVVAVSRSDDAVSVTTATGHVESFDAVVMATHADQTLQILADPEPAEREILSVFDFQKNKAILHIDATLLPRYRRAWASWNYHVQGEKAEVSVTYNLSRLQRLASPRPILVTLNPDRTIAPEAVLRTFIYHHPVFNSDAIAAQQRLAEINGRRNTYFCGAYWRYGFHEDGVASALAVGDCFGVGK